MHPLARLRTLVLLPLLTLAVLAGVTALGPSAEAAPTRRETRAAGVALQQVGDPYRYGATGPRAFDCSGLMQYSFARAGLRIPRTASAQARDAHHIKRSKLRRGDLMFFHRGSHVYHVAMFLRWSKGQALMLHAPGTGKRVRIDRPWTGSWFAGTMR